MKLLGKHWMRKRSRASREYNSSKINISVRYPNLVQSLTNWIAFLGKLKEFKKREISRLIKKL